MNVGSILIERGAITPEQLEQANLQCRPTDRLDQVLVRLGYCGETAVLEALGELYQFDVVDLAQPDAPVDVELLRKLPSKLVHRSKLVPLDKVNGSLRVATPDPFQIYAFDELRMICGLEVKPVLAKVSEINEIIKKYFGVGGDTVSQLVDEDDDVQIVSDVRESAGDLAEMAQDASVVKLVNEILLEAINERASDVHIEPYEDDLKIRYRVDGILRNTNVPPQIRQLQAAIISRIKILSNLNIAERRVPQDGSFKIKVYGREIDLRVSIIPMIHGEGVVMRILDKQSILLSLEDLGFDKDMLKIFEKVISQPHGILLVTGPTGSGKTTTLYAALRGIVTEAIKVLTVEDPVEYHLDGINQVNVNMKAGLTFARGMRSFLRHDPDVIMVGEIRDIETAETAVQASLTGHLVLSTLHTNDAPTAITRMLDMGVEPFLVASSVEAALAQRLIRTLCPHCKEPYEPDRLDVPEDFDPQGATIYRPSGCRECRNTGYAGRKGIFELMVMDDELRELVLQRVSSNKIKNLAVKHGLVLLRDDGWSKVRQGITTISEVVRATKA
ncbi:MAG: type II secretion system ATPase GspE [Phycisphaerae bacterium]|nr:type II secretion system ATPase GspE [Phycisphaerae bacterium]